MQELIDKTDDRVINVAEQTALALETCYAHYNKAFMKRVLRRALDELLIFTLHGTSGIKKPFEDATSQVATTPKSFVINVSTVARHTVAIRPIARYAAKTVKHEVKESVKDPVLTPPSPSPSCLDSSSDEVCKCRKDRRFRKKSSCRTLFVISLHIGTWALEDQ